MLNFIKDKWIRFKKFIIAFLIGGTVLAAGSAFVPIGNSPVAPFDDGIERVTAPENNGFFMGTQNYQTAFAQDITEDRALQYKLDDKFISFKPVALRVDGVPLKGLSNATKDVGNKYKSVFGVGIDLEINTSQRVWEKLVTIDSLGLLGILPDTVQNLELVFEIESNFIIDGWDRKSDLEIVDKIRLGDFSYIEQPHVWDSYREEVCEPLVDPDDDPVCETLTNKIELRGYFSKQGNKLFFTKEIPISWLKTAQFPVYTDADITYGTASTFLAAATTEISTAEIDTDKFTVCYSKPDFDIHCRSATVFGTTITYGIEVEPDTGDGQMTCTAKLDTDKFIVVWRDAQNANASGRVGEVSGTTITLGPTLLNLSHEDLDSDRDGSNWCAGMGTDRFIVAYETDAGAGQDGFGRLGTTTATTTITMGTELVFDTNEVRYPTVEQIDTNKVIVIYEDQTTTGDLQGRSATTSGTVIGPWGTEASINTQDTALPSSAFITTDKIAVTYSNQTSGDIESVVLTISGTTITVGTIVALNAAAGSFEASVAIPVDTTRFVAAYKDAAASDKGNSKLGTISGDTTLTYGSAVEFESGVISGAFDDFGLHGDLISTAKIVICFQDDDDADNGKCIIGVLDNTFGDNPGAGDWADSDWLKRIKITSDNTLVNEAVKNLFYDMSDAPADFFTNVDSLGRDIRVTQSDGTTEVAVEVVTISTASSTGELHFESTGNSTSADVDWYIYYDNSVAGTAPPTDAAGQHKVWIDGYKSVYHLQETFGPRFDSASGTNDLADNNTVGFDGIGKLGGAALFDDAATEFLDTDIEWVTALPFTMCGWGKPDDAANDSTVASISKSTATQRAGQLTFEDDAGGDDVRAITKDGAATSEAQTTSGWTVDTFHYVCGVWATTTSRSAYIDGGNKGTNTDSRSDVTPERAAIGRETDQTPGDYFSGLIDEVTISDVTRSDNWVSTHFNNQTDANTFWTTGAQEVESVGGVQATSTTQIIEG